MPQGRKPKPRLTTSASDGPVGAPRMPRGLSVGAKAAWKELCATLSAQGTLQPGDGPLIEVTAVTLDRMREARRIVEREGFTVAGQRGGLVKHPALMVEQQMSVELRKLAESLGLGATGRARLGLRVMVTPKESVTDWLDREFSKVSKN